MDYGTLYFLGVLIFLAIAVFFFERISFSAKEIVLIAVLAAIAGLGRVPFAVIPSAQPTTFMVILSGYVFGPIAGFIVGMVAALVSNIFLGQGPWTIVQMFAWGLCGVSAGVLGKIFPRTIDVRKSNVIPAKAGIYRNLDLMPVSAGMTTTVLVTFGFLWGYIFGWITNLWYWLSFIYPLNFKTWAYINAASFWFDTIHAVTNVLFLIFLGSDFIKILQRFKKKLHYTITPHLNPLPGGEEVK